MYLQYRQQVSFEVKIPKNWFSEPNTESKIHLDTVRFFPLLEQIILSENRTANDSREGRRIDVRLTGKGYETIRKSLPQLLS